LTQFNAVLDLIIINLDFFHLALLLFDTEAKCFDFVTAGITLHVLLHLQLVDLVRHLVSVQHYLFDLLFLAIYFAFDLRDLYHNVLSHIVDEKFRLTYQTDQTVSSLPPILLDRERELFVNALSTSEKRTKVALGSLFLNKLVLADLTMFILDVNVFHLHAPSF
jgi:hypothetical protein